MNAGRTTAKEVVEAIGGDVSKIGKQRLVIGGIRGIVEQDHPVKLLEGKIDVIFGDETHELEVGSESES